MSNFPDLSHFEQIRQRLWCGREFGQAAVMIGSGFSRNAEKTAPSTPDFPLWEDLASNIYNELYPHTDWQNLTDEQKEKKTKARIKALANPPALASEYEVSFGSSALHDLLIRSIPDSQYNPGKLHKLLMSLPWSDVFTTNYDTLLERTRPFVHDRKYDLICTTSDIPGRMKPRIVKLHGSFPSYRPFILSEENYRTYPRRFAPFVNMVQQSIMENIFCLIGFSGEDPNFLNWIGWVRDNLGESTPPIYLCGLLDNLNESKKNILRQKNIITVDLSPIFPETDWLDSSLRHSRAIEWFLLSLMKGKPPNIINWPESWSSCESDKSEDLPDLVSGFTSPATVDEIEPYSDQLNELTLRHLYTIWAQHRQDYPGWIVCPKRNRKHIWLYTERWIWPILNSIDCLPYPEKLLLIYELNWRLEITLTPLLFPLWIEKFTSVLELCNPYPRLLDLPNAQFQPGKQECSDWNWHELCKSWVELAFALARAAREDHDVKQFQLWMGHLEKIIPQNSEWQARWFYEKCLFHLFRVEFSQVRKTLENWLSHPALDFWEIKRASIFAELGELKESERIAEVALDKIRSRLQPFLTDYTVLSQEGWAMYLLLMIQDEHKLFGRKSKLQQYRDRWEKLETFRCNPGIDLEYLSERIAEPPPKQKPHKEEKLGIYPGTISTTYYTSSEPFEYSRLPAFSFLRMLEEGGIPLRCGITNLYISASEPAKWIRPFAPFRSLSCILRAQNFKEIQNCFGFIYWSTLDQKTIDDLYSWLFDCLAFYTERLSRGQLLERRAEREISKMVIEVTSHICFRFSEEQVEGILPIALKLHQNMSSAQYSDYYTCIDNLFKGILYSLSQQKIISIMPNLLSLAIPDENGFNVAWVQSFQDPFHHLDIGEVCDHASHPNLSAQIRNLLRILKEGTSESRNRSIIRLSKLNKLNLLNAEEMKSFATSLWEKRDEKCLSLPQIPETRFYKYSVLRWPEPVSGIAEKGIRSFLLSQDAIEPEDERFFREWLGATKQPVMNQGGIDWSTDDITHLLDKILIWWDKTRNMHLEYMRLHDSPLLEDVKHKLDQVVETVAYVIFPKQPEVSGENKVKMEALISDLEEAGICIIPALTMNLFIEPENLEQVSRELRINLASDQPHKVGKTIQSLSYWLAYSRTNSVPEPSPDLLNELVNRVFNRRQPGLDAAIGWLSNIVKEMSEVLNAEHCNSILLALEYLLEETELPSLEELEMTIESNSLIRFEDRPEYRRRSSLLAYRLYQYFEKDKQKLPDILIKWRNVSEKSILPRVREIWL